MTGPPGGESPDPRAAAAEADSVQALRDDQHGSAAEVLARAFYDDPVMTWFYRDDSRRLEQLRRTYALMGEHVWFRQGLTMTTASLAGVAAWAAPQRWRVSLLEQLRMTPQFLAAIGMRDLPRAFRGFNLLEAKHPADDHFYLAVVGVDPRWQGKGIGTALLRPMLERCDRERAAAFLEASSPHSRACYERSGFVVEDEFTFPGGPPMWAMRRAPGAGGS